MLKMYFESWRSRGRKEGKLQEGRDVNEKEMTGYQSLDMPGLFQSQKKLSLKNMWKNLVIRLLVTDYL